MRFRWTACWPSERAGKNIIFCAFFSPLILSELYLKQHKKMSQRKYYNFQRRRRTTVHGRRHIWSLNFAHIVSLDTLSNCASNKKIVCCFSFEFSFLSKSQREFSVSSYTLVDSRHFSVSFFCAKRNKHTLIKRLIQLENCLYVLIIIPSIHLSF